MDEPANDDDQLFAEAYPALRRFAAVVAPLDLDPDDLLQEAVARALQLGPLARLDHPAAYLKRSMVNLAANHNRSRGRERRATARLEAVPATESRPAYPSDLTDLDQLEPADRAALYLAEVERIPLGDVARILSQLLADSPTLSALASAAAGPDQTIRGPGVTGGG